MTPAEIWHTLRPYQKKGVQGISDALEDSASVLYVAPTGSGKTICFCFIAAHQRAAGKRSLVLVHRRELIHQTRRAFASFGTPCGIIAAGEPYDPTVTIQVASSQLLARRIRSKTLDLQGWEPNTIILDECFCPGTMVGNRPIEVIQPGDLVPSFEPASGRIVRRRVVRMWKKRTTTVHRIALANGGSVVCTPNHLFLTPGGWTNAASLAKGAPVYAARLLGVQDAVRAVDAPPDVNVEVGAATSLLLSRVLSEERVETFVGGHGEDQSPARLGAHEGQQPHEPAGNPAEDDRDDSEDEPSPEGARRERVSHAGATGTASRSTGAGLDSGARRGNGEGRARERDAEPLQDRHRQPGIEDRGRGGRRVPCGPEAAGQRRAKDRVLGITWVVSVEVFQQGRDGEFERLCPGGAVYDLEIEGTHTYLANGFAVHNCHHSTAPSLVSVLQHWPDAKNLGVTATPCRLDGKGLGRVYDAMVLGPAPAELIAQGYLANFRVFSHPIDDFDRKALHKRMGDFVASEMEEGLDTQVCLGNVIEHYKRHLDGQPALAFCVSVDHARHLARAFVKDGVPASSIDGKLKYDDRDQILGAYARGEINVLTSCEILGEGLDVPDTAGVILVRPTTSLTYHLQMIGRAFRPKSDGKIATILDHVGNVLELGMPDEAHVWTLADMVKPKAVELIVCKHCREIMRKTSSYCPSCTAYVGEWVDCESCHQVSLHADVAPCLACDGNPAGAPKLPAGQQRALRQIDGELVELRKKDLSWMGQGHIRFAIQRCKTLAELTELATVRSKAGEIEMKWGPMSWARWRWRHKLEMVETDHARLNIIRARGQRETEGLITSYENAEWWAEVMGYDRHWLKSFARTKGLRRAVASGAALSSGG